MSVPTIEEAVAAAIRGGCTLVQLREKTAESREFYDYAVRVKKIADAHGVPLIINDRADIAVAVDATGVHVGQTDLPPAVARKILGPDKIIGVSAANFEEARQAVADGADYLGVGAMYATDTKTEAATTSLAELRRIRAAFALPIVAIGGVNPNTIPSLRNLDLDGIAVVSAILAQPNIEQATQTLRHAFTTRKE